MPDDPVGVLNGQLTASDTDEMHFFSVTKDAAFFLNLESLNADYYIQLYLVDYSTGQAGATNIVCTPGATIYLEDLPAGDYMLYVASTGALGHSYTLAVNAVNPAGSLGVEYLGPTLENIILHYANGDIYANGKFVFNYDNLDLSTFDWSRKFQLNYPEGGYHARLHAVEEVKVANINFRRPFSYSSSYASSTFAVEVTLDEGTLFSYRNTYYHNGGGFTTDTVDTTGHTTPRRLAYGEGVLIFSLNSMKPIDLIGDLNYYYYHKIEGSTETDL